MNETQRGRPRSAERHHAILESTRALLASDTYEQLTIEAIAADAGVSKQTVYKWWPSKAAVVTEAIMAGYLRLEAAPAAETNNVAIDIGAWFHTQLDRLTDPTSAALTRAMTAAAAESDDSQRMFDQLAEPSRQILLARLQIAVQQGELRADADLIAAADAILSTILLISVSRQQAGTHEHADGLLDLLFHGMASNGNPSTRPTRRD